MLAPTEGISLFADLGHTTILFAERHVHDVTITFRPYSSIF